MSIPVSGLSVMWLVKITWVEAILISPLSSVGILNNKPVTPLATPYSLPLEQPKVKKPPFLLNSPLMAVAHFKR